ncbi:hypothetical protein E1295_41360 [Nonomuraea mesophila]|uniref:Peptidase n=1 Tax=Nonomuraea mesophila TaxID=2530382 RepID=A0A4R5EAX7_9ACTN|nr:hypothetical protein [Nonomuraea mesophila]TDE30050.1 hypothetical protein E1295_41360 [Nonomuraea mesophila]
MSPQVSRRAALTAVLLLGLAADAPAPGPPALPARDRDLWPDGQAVARGARSLVTGHHAAPGTLDELARRADSAALRVTAVLGRPVRPVVIVPDTAQDAARLAGSGPLDGLAAVADDGRVIVVPESFGRLTSLGKDVVLTHELTHVAAGTGGLPVWLYEGFADYVAYRDAGLPVRTAAAELAAEVRAGRVPAALPGPEAFAVGGPGPGRLALAYQEAWLACRFLSGRFGERSLVRLYRDAQVAGVRAALAALGLSVSTLTARWRVYVREQLT